ncbi:MAG TPA: carboxylating nicotinate-nucleotide diphosphorylase [Gemmatimonadaceae bacterium]|nr:carboxylating nicotinate-nucleotide diphosphorylase [Gemmatimonadaceae bacterium]
MQMQQEPEHRHTPSPPRTITPFSVSAVTTASRLRFPLSQYELAARVRQALEEDSAFNDVTTIATVVSSRHARAKLVARQSGTIAGIPLALEAFRQLDPKIVMRVDAEDGHAVTRGATVLFLTGHARGLLSAERTALNFMQRMSGIATLTARYVAAVRGTRARILDTRKTTPGWRALEKYAVRAGGGTNHRMDLADSVLIKDNHLRAVDGDVRLAIRRTRELEPNAKVEVECDNVAQVEAALEGKADIILLDNMPLDEMRLCVSTVAGRALVEASGGVHLDNVRAIAETGVDFISVGALTHSPPAMNLALDFE